MPRPKRQNSTETSHDFNLGLNIPEISESVMPMVSPPLESDAILMGRLPQRISEGGGGGGVVGVKGTVGAVVDVSGIWQSPRIKPTWATAVAVVFVDEPVTTLSAVPVTETRTVSVLGS